MNIEKFLTSLLQGTPTAIIVGIFILFVTNPLSHRIDKLADALNREIIPTVNELKKGKTPIQPLAEMTKRLEHLIASYEEKQAKLIALQTSFAKASASLEVAARVNRKFALAAPIAATLLLDKSKEYKKGDIVRYRFLTAEGQKVGAFEVTNPLYINTFRKNLTTEYYEELGLKPVYEP